MNTADMQRLVEHRAVLNAEEAQREVESLLSGFQAQAAELAALRTRLARLNTELASLRQWAQSIPTQAEIQAQAEQLKHWSDMTRAERTEAHARWYRMTNGTNGGKL